MRWPTLDKAPIQAVRVQAARERRTAQLHAWFALRKNITRFKKTVSNKYVTHYGA